MLLSFYYLMFSDLDICVKLRYVKYLIMYCIKSTMYVQMKGIINKTKVLSSYYKIHLFIDNIYKHIDTLNIFYIKTLIFLFGLKYLLPYFIEGRFSFFLRILFLVIKFYSHLAAEWLNIIFLP